MAAIKESAIQNAVDELMADLSQKLIIDRFHAGLRSNFYDHKWVETIFQSATRHECTTTDAAVFACVWTLMHLGLMQTLRIKLGQQPSRDRDLESNIAVLGSLPQQFQAKLWGRNFQQDGSLDWKLLLSEVSNGCRTNLAGF